MVDGKNRWQCNVTAAHIKTKELFKDKDYRLKRTAPMRQKLAECYKDKAWCQNTTYKAHIIINKYWDVYKHAKTDDPDYPKAKEYCENILNLLQTHPNCYFNREAFYSQALKLISFKSVDRPITFDDIDSLNGISGVWSKETEQGIILDVAETKDLGAKMRFSIRAFAANSNKSDTELKQNNLFLRKKYRDMDKTANSKIIFKLIAINTENKETKQAIEIQYAHDTKVIFWSPTPIQKPLLIQIYI